jgi:hypothetical protein
MSNVDDRCAGQAPTGEEVRNALLGVEIVARTPIRKIECALNIDEEQGRHLLHRTDGLAD